MKSEYRPGFPGRRAGIKGGGVSALIQTRIRGEVGREPPEDLVTGLQEAKMATRNGDGTQPLQAEARPLRGGCPRGEGLLTLGDMPLEGRREAARGMGEIDVNREARMDVRQSWHLHSHTQGPGS